MNCCTCMFMQTRHMAAPCGRTCVAKSKRESATPVVETAGGQIPNRRPLSERPAHIEGRQQVGHWKCDTVIGANHKQAIVTVVERKSGYAVMAKVSKKTADLVGSAIIQALNPLKARVKTLTYDNGKEFSRHAEIDKALGSTGYFARPFGRWEHGSNENLNCLLRQCVPKKRNMANITDEEIKMIENILKNRPTND